jgi:hypothetical protein
MLGSFLATGGQRRFLLLHEPDAKFRGRPCWRCPYAEIVEAGEIIAGSLRALIQGIILYHVIQNQLKLVKPITAVAAHGNADQLIAKTTRS